MEFLDRRDAGRLLAAQLQPLRSERPIVLALPRGGVPVALEVARVLGAPLEILAVRKLGAPGNPEFGIGAIAEDGTVVLDRTVARRVGMTRRLLEATMDTEVQELRRRVLAYRDGRPRLPVRGRTVIVVDDGLATGLTVLAAVRALRNQGAGRIVVAVPVGARESVARVGEEADEVVCLTIPNDLFGVGHWYRDFAPVSDAEVLEHLAAAAAPAAPEPHADSRPLRLSVDDVDLAGDLALPAHASGLVIFAHGSGSSRLSVRNRAVAAALNDAGFATLLFDLLTDDEAQRRELVFDIPLLAHRLEVVTRWALEDPLTRGLPVGYFGASTGAAGALRAAAAAGDVVSAVVSRGGRPDLAAESLALVQAPTLLLVGSRDREVLELNRHAAAMLSCRRQLVIVEGAGHLFEEPGAMDTVATAAAAWFGEHLTTATPPLAATGS
jgi:predicted phosphoribosyltransferase/predicted alpha/beta-hydrolase family hydrolase